MQRHHARMLRVLGVVAVVVAITFFARTVNWAEAWRAMRSASIPLLLLAAALNLVSIALKGLRWAVFLRPIGVRSLGLATRATFAGAALNNVLVANSGEAARVIFVARTAGVPSARVLATLALERLFEIVGFVGLLAVSVSFLALPPMLERLRPVALVALVGMMALFAVLARSSAKPDENLPAARSRRQRLRQYFSRFVRTMAGISTPARFLAATLLTLGVWALQFASYHLTAIAAGFPVSAAGSVAALLAVNVSFAIRATPGNVGVFQVVYALVASSLGLDRDAAIGVGLLIQTQQQVPVIIAGLVAAPGALRASARSGSSDPAAVEPALDLLPLEPVPDRDSTRVAD